MIHNSTSLQASPNSFPVLDPDLFDWEEGEDIMGMIRQLVNGTHPGLLTTVDAEGRPHARWMASLSMDEVPKIYTLTSLTSRKVGQIENHPAVSWMFCNSSLTLILNLDGKATVVRDKKLINHVWFEVKNKEQAYFSKNSMEELDLAVIETQLEHIECCTPKSAFRFAVDINKIRRVESDHSCFKEGEQVAVNDPAFVDANK